MYVYSGRLAFEIGVLQRAEKRLCRLINASKDRYMISMAYRVLCRVRRKLYGEA